MRKQDGTIINKGYYHDEQGNVFSRNDTLSPELAQELFGMEKIDFKGQKIFITPPEYIYILKSYTQSEKDKVDLKFMESRIDRSKLARINELSNCHQITQEKVESKGLFQTNSEKKDLIFYHGGAEPTFTLEQLDVLRKSQKQQNRNNSYVGFYMYSEQDRDGAFHYAEQENQRNNTTTKGVEKIVLDGNVNIFQMPPFSITRITQKQIAELQQLGYDLIAGKMLGKTEYVLINKDKIKSMSFESMDMRYESAQGYYSAPEENIAIESFKEARSGEIEKRNAIRQQQLSYAMGLKTNFAEYDQYAQNAGGHKK